MKRSEIRLTDVLLDDFPAFIQEVSGGCELDIAPGFGNFTGVVNGHLERQPARLGVVDDKAGRVIDHGHGQGVETLGGLFLMRADQLGHFSDAGHTTGRPEIHQYDLALEVGRGFFAAVEQHKS